jgi:hypothetical protein
MTETNPTACSVLGEQPKGSGSKVELLKKSDFEPVDVTTNLRLDLKLPDIVTKRGGLWETMETSTYDRLAHPMK